MTSRKDKKGRVLRKGESYSDSKGMYLYTYTDPFGNRRYIYVIQKIDEIIERKRKQLTDF